MLKELEKYLVKPELYAPGTNCLWDDPYISEMMLDAHLNPDFDASTRKHSFVDKSVAWIAKIAPPSGYPRLLDLGCGPGLYAERFHKAGYKVTGIDFSERSVRYAEVQAALDKNDIEYLYQNYLTIDYIEQFDLATLIYCDYAVLSATDRSALLRKVYRALKPGGKFIFDVFTHKMRRPESRSWYYAENGGFYSDKPHLCLETVYQYDKDCRAELRQSIVICEESIQCYNIWDHFFNKAEIIKEVTPTGFREHEIYSDIAGKKYSDSGEELCVVLTKS